MSSKSMCLTCQSRKSPTTSAVILTHGFVASLPKQKHSALHSPAITIKKNLEKFPHIKT